MPFVVQRNYRLYWGSSLLPRVGPRKCLIRLRYRVFDTSAVQHAARLNTKPVAELGCLTNSKRSVPYPRSSNVRRFGKAKSSILSTPV